MFAAGRLSDHRWVSGPATAVVEFFRAVPLLILIFILYFGVSRGLGVNISAFTALVLGLTLYNGSVLAEIFRAGVASLPRGQSEAAYALGMRKTQVMTNVLLPQALRAMLPTIVSQLVVVLKDTRAGLPDPLPRAALPGPLPGQPGPAGLADPAGGDGDRGHLHHDVPAALAVRALPGAPRPGGPGGWTRRRRPTTPLVEMEQIRAGIP